MFSSFPYYFSDLLYSKILAGCEVKNFVECFSNCFEWVFTNFPVAARDQRCNMKRASVTA